MTTKRAPGTGSITPVKNPDGSIRGYWARLWVEGKNKSFGVHPTPEVAAETLDSVLEARAHKPGGAGGSKLTFATFAKDVLDLREGDGMRSVDSERNRFDVHLKDCAIAGMSVDSIASADIAALGRAIAKKSAKDTRGDRKLARNTVKRVLGLVSVVFREAIEQGKRTDNPCLGVKLRTRKDGDEDDGTVEEWLRGEEQERFLACEDIPEWGRVLAQFAWGVGLRQGEQWHLQLRDIHFASDEGCACGAKKCVDLREHGPHVHIRYGSSRGGKKLSPKSGKTRRTPLFGHGLAAARRWLEMLPTYCPENVNGLAFPGPSGARRPKGGPTRSVATKIAKGKFKIDKVYLLPEWLKAAQIDRHVRWHDLRHTCASSLISGTWGRKWSLDEVCKMLGHSSIKVTERYAHLCDSTLRDAAASTGARYGDVTTNPVDSDDPAEKPERRGSDSNRRMTVLQGNGLRSNSARMSAVVTPSSHAEALLQAVAAGDYERIAALAVTVAAEHLAGDASKKRKVAG